MRYFELCDKSVAFANEIIKSPEFVELLKIKEEITTTIPLIVEEFNTAKEKYDEVNKYGTYHPDYQKVKLRLIKAKEALYRNELVKKYKELERKIQQMLNDASKEIVKALKMDIVGE